MIKIIVDNQTKVIMVVTEAENVAIEESTGIIKYFDKPFGPLSTDATVYEFESLPMGVLPLQYCYTPEQGFYPNEIFLRTHPQYVVFAQLRENLKFAIDLLIEHGII